VLRRDQNRHGTLLTQEGKKLVQLVEQEVFLGHRIQIAGQAVDDDDARPITLDHGAHFVGEATRRHFGRIDLLHAQ
jgi:hypothetical protein